MAKRVLIAGASGVVGLSAMQHFGALAVASCSLSRRVPRSTFGVPHYCVDLTDPASVAGLGSALEGVTHLVYAALYERPGLVAGWREQEQMQTNDRMLRNLLEPLRQTGSLQHVTLLQGTKAYGAHVRPIDLPARENRSEHVHDNFYWLQERYLKAVAAEDGFRWTILRPQIIFGGATGVAMNLIPVLGVYGALLRAQGEPLHFPGGPSGVLEAVDADLLAQVIGWAGEAPQAGNEIFNVANGDVFAWSSVWPAIARALAMEVGEHRPVSVARMLEDGAERWRRLALAEGLLEPELHALVGESHHYADFTMAYGFEGGTPPPAIVSTIKLRQAGFHAVMDTEMTLTRWLRRLQRERLLPQPT